MPELNWKSENTADAFKTFKARMQLYLEDAEITEDAKKATKIKLAVGDEGMRRILASGLSAADQKKPAELWKLLESQLDAAVKINFRVHRLEFANMRQQPSEAITDFISRLREKANNCSFTVEELNERLIEMTILSTPFEDFKKELLVKEKGYNIQTVIERGREYEAIAASQTSLRSLNQPSLTATNKVDALQKQRKPKTCGNCGLQHSPKSCPAYNDKCSYCQNMGHWTKCCRKKKIADANANLRKDSGGPNKRQTKGNYQRKRKQSQRRHVHAVSEDEDESEETLFDSLQVDSLKAKTEEAYITLQVRHKSPHVSGSMRLKVDTGSGGNTLPLRTYHQMFCNTPVEEILAPEPGIKLTSYSGNTITCIGSIYLGMRKKRHPEEHVEKFYVVDVEGPAILGLPSLKRLQIVDLNLDALQPTLQPQPENKVHPALRGQITSVSQLKAAYPNQFDRIGKFREPAKLYLKEDAVPFSDAPRKTSLSLKPKIKEELQRLEKDGIIKKVSEHTDWCSSLAYVTKADGSLRVCLDPQKLNQNLKRCPHKIPTLEELNPTFAQAKVFSKLDAKAGYWSIQLEPTSQLLTTFRTPFGRYCWQRLPFGLNVSQDIFQSRMDEILEDLPGVASIADDIGVCGTDQMDHDKNLIRLMERAAKHGLVFNANKCIIGKEEISFFGNQYTGEGISPDPNKIRDLNRMPTPKSKDELKRLLGLTTYLSQYIPNYSSKAKPLRDLTKDETPFEWDAIHDQCLHALKQAITTSKALAYYDSSLPLTLEVDASQKGLGAALLQRDRVIAFASKTLTTAQSNYSNIEREALALVHGIQRFHTYVYGREVNVITDHKPLVNLWQRPLTSAPPRLQRLFLKLQGYNLQVSYKPGSEMILSDTLSRLPNPENNREISLDMRVDGIEWDDFNTKPIELLRFTSNRLEELRKGTDQDPTLRTLKHIIMEGWPESIKQCHQDIRPFFNHRECYAVEDGVIFKGRQVLIPESARDRILSQLHASHQGIKKTQALASQSVYWPNINKDIENLVSRCGPCQKYQAQQRDEETLHHHIPPIPWSKLGSDLFQIDDTQYLIIIDYFSKYPVIYELKHATSAEVTKYFKEACSLLGRPSTIVSDNGPQYTGATFKQFIYDWGIEHVTSSPRYPKSNGLAERTVGTVKHILKKCKESRSDIPTALLHLRATPIDSKTPSPGELLFGRQLSTTLPSRAEPKGQHLETRDHLYNRLPSPSNNVLQPLYPGQPVRVRDEESKTWQPGTILDKLPQPRSYIVKTENGSQLRRNRQHLRTVPLTSDRPKDSVQKPEEWEPPKEAITHIPVECDSPRKVTFKLPEGIPPKTKENAAARSPDAIPSKKPPRTVTKSGRSVVPPSRYGH